DMLASVNCRATIAEARALLNGYRLYNTDGGPLQIEGNQENTILWAPQKASHPWHPNNIFVKIFDRQEVLHPLLISGGNEISKQTSLFGKDKLETPLLWLSTILNSAHNFKDHSITKYRAT
ncbi:hypothetical protein AMTR_s00137p00063560, partial [Amborella trichopoda]